MTAKRIFSALLATLLIIGTLSACDNAKEPEDTTVADTIPESETLSHEEQKLADEKAYLDTVTYLDFELTGEDQPYFLGRWFEKEINGTSHMVTTTDGSHLYFLVKGATELQVNFTCITKLETPVFSYSIDGVDPVRQRIDEPTVTLPDDGFHTVRIIADGLTEHEAKWKGEEGFALSSIVPNTGYIAGIRPTDKVIFFYGDSITEGVVALGLPNTSVGNSATNAYAWHTARELGAVSYPIGYGGSGLHNSGTFAPMSKAMEYLSETRKVADSPVANITPDLIVINHGANDYIISTRRFGMLLQSTVEKLQTKYPGVPIIYVVAFWECSNPAIIEQGQKIDELAPNFKNFHVIHTADWDLTYTDEVHPDVAGARKAGSKLAMEIRKIMGEDFFA